jgi:hypothetical protein
VIVAGVTEVILDTKYAGLVILEVICSTPNSLLVCWDRPDGEIK